MRSIRLLPLALLTAFALACDDGDATEEPGAGGADGAVEAPGSGDAGGHSPPDAQVPDAALEPVEQLPESAIYSLVRTCLALTAPVDGETRWLQAQGDGYAFAAADADGATPLFAQASDLGTYLLYDDGGYVVAEDGPLVRQTELQSDVYLFDDTYISGAEWIVERSERVALSLHLKHRRTGRWMGSAGLVADVADAVAVTTEPAEGCQPHPEMTLDAAGEVSRTHFEDGELFGFVDAHSHILTNYSYGGGGVFHGAPFHRLGVEHAMGSCEPFHGPDGRADILGYGRSAGGIAIDVAQLVPVLTTGLLPDPVHATDGWPTFSEWTTATHQTQYYRWLERAWLAGLRLVVMHAVNNEALCAIMGDTGFQPMRWPCRDMINIDRQFDEIHTLARYIDAQAGGPGEGFLRVVTSPDEARAAIGQGKMAVVMGIEVPNLFDCYVTPGEGDPECDREHIEAQLDAYYARGLRVLFPTHKTDNAFTPGDGSKGIFELANLVQTGHWSNFTQDCPEVQTVFDRGQVLFGGLNAPREDHLAESPNEPIQFTDSPLADLAPYVAQIGEGPLDGEWCQAVGLTDQGRALLEGMMARGIIPELDHLPRKSYVEAFEMMVAADYPVAATHRNTFDGRLWETGGLSVESMRRCADPEQPGELFERFLQQRDDRVAAGLHPAVGFGFDLNGLAGVPGPRFGERCGDGQQNPVQYPFTSYAGDVTFTPPAMGERDIDFNTEGMIHIGLVPELIEDARRTGTTDEELEILFRSAEGYIQTWERAMARSQALRER